MFFFENYFVAILGDSSQLVAAFPVCLSSPRRPSACLVSRGLFACLVPLMTYSTYPIKLSCIDRAVVDSFYLEARFASTVDVVVPSGISDVPHPIFWKVFSIRSFLGYFPRHRAAFCLRSFLCLMRCGHMRLSRIFLRL